MAQLFITVMHCSVLCTVVLHQVVVQPAQDATAQAQDQSVEEAAERCLFLHVLLGLVSARSTMS